MAVTQRSLGKKCKYAAGRFSQHQQGGIISLEGSCKLKVYIIYPKTTTDVTTKSYS